MENKQCNRIAFQSNVVEIRSNYVLIKLYLNSFDVFKLLVCFEKQYQDLVTYIK